MQQKHVYLTDLFDDGLELVAEGLYPPKLKFSSAGGFFWDGAALLPSGAIITGKISLFGGTYLLIIVTK